MDDLAVGMQHEFRDRPIAVWAFERPTRAGQSFGSEGFHAGQPRAIGGVELGERLLSGPRVGERAVVRLGAVEMPGVSLAENGRDDVAQLPRDGRHGRWVRIEAGKV